MHQYFVRELFRFRIMYPRFFGSLRFDFRIPLCEFRSLFSRGAGV